MGSCCSLAENDDIEGEESAKGFGACLERFCERLETWPFLVLGGVCLAASFALTGHGCSGGGAAHFKAWNPAFVTVFICGLPIAREALEALFVRRRIIAPLLITCAMVACLAIGQVFAAGEVAFIMALGETLEAATLKRARRGVSRLVSLVPPTARYIVTCPKCLAKGERYRDVPVDKIEVGDGVRVLPGETIPVDGVVMEGTSTVDQSVMTGESLPVDKGTGDEVYSGTINQFGALDIRVTKKGEDSSLQKLVRLVREAGKKKAPVQRIADKWAAILVPSALAAAVLVGLGVWAWHAAGMGAPPSGTTPLADALVRGVTVMVVFCPCALALATPTAIMAAIGQAAKHGVIVKSGEALEKMGVVTVACLDKTGTLTEGKLSVAAVETLNATCDRNDVLRLAAAVEASSEHPLAQAIVAAHGAQLPSVQAFAMTPGKGVKGMVDGAMVVCGTAAWLRENDVADVTVAEAAAERLRGAGNAVVLVAAEGKAIGLIALADTPRADAPAAVAALAAAGVRPCLLTGDHGATAKAVAAALGIADVRAELLPARKAELVAALQAEGESACMVGDGVNDAVALRTADVGVAMGGVGSDIAVEAADVALVGDDLTRLAYLKRLSVACVRLIRLNISISMAINAVAVACSALGLLTPVTGALVHNAGSVLVVLNAALLYDRDFSTRRER